MTLPPLPEPDLLVFDDALQSPIDGWTRSQVHAYAVEAVEAEREACAQLCETVTRPLNDGFDGAFDNGIEVGGDMCATAIRARGAKGQGNG
jgi:hypothetical protein